MAKSISSRLGGYLTQIGKTLSRKSINSLIQLPRLASGKYGAQALKNVINLYGRIKKLKNQKGLTVRSIYTKLKSRQRTSTYASSIRDLNRVLGRGYYDESSLYYKVFTKGEDRGNIRSATKRLQTITRYARREIAKGIPLGQILPNYIKRYGTTFKEGSHRRYIYEVYKEIGFAAPLSHLESKLIHSINYEELKEEYIEYNALRKKQKESALNQREYDKYVLLTDKISRTYYALLEDV